MTGCKASFLNKDLSVCSFCTVVCFVCLSEGGWDEGCSAPAKDLSESSLPLSSRLFTQKSPESVINCGRRNVDLFSQLSRKEGHFIGETHTHTH